MSVKAELTERDRRYLERSLNGPVWKVVLSVGAPLALYQELAMIFTVMDTMMVSNISVTVMAVSVAAVVIARFRKEYLSERVCTADQGA